VFAEAFNRKIKYGHQGNQDLTGLET